MTLLPKEIYTLAKQMLADMETEYLSSVSSNDIEFYPKDVETRFEKYKERINRVQSFVHEYTVYNEEKQNKEEDDDPWM